MAGSGGCRARSACSGAGSSSGGLGPGLASIRLRLKAMDEAVESGGRRLHPVCPDGPLLDRQQHHASSISRVLALAQELALEKEPSFARGTFLFSQTIMQILE